MRVVFFIDHLRADGTQKALTQIVAGLCQRGHRIGVVCLNDSYDRVVLEQLSTAGAEVRVIGRRSLIFGYGLLITLIWLHARHFDAMVTLLFTSDVLGRLVARAAGIRPIVSSIRARNTHYATLQRLLIRMTMPFADTVVLNSAAVRDFAIQQEGARPDRIVVIPNAVDPVLFTNSISRHELCRRFNLPPSGPVLGSIGRLTFQKGFDLLLRSFARLERKDATLLIIGTGEEGPCLKALAAELGITERVCFAGYRRDTAEILGALDLYIHPARFEGMPNALLEAMAAGCPIIASNVDGNRELIIDGEHGWLVPTEDINALTLAISAVLHDTKEAQRRSSAAKQRATAYFSLVAMVNRWEQVLEGTNGQ